MAPSIVFWGFLAVALGLAWRLGGQSDRAIIGIVLGGAVCTWISNKVLGLEDALLAVAVIDLALLAALVTLALRSRRYWPLWFAGFQFAAVLTSTSAIIFSGDNRWIFQMLGGFWAIPALVSMCIGLAKDRLAKISVAD